MRKIDNDGLLMCRIQGKIFEKSIDQVNTSSPIFIKNYMNSIDARSMDKEVFLNTSRYDDQILEDLNKDKPYGKVRYSEDEMYWIGYLYRYFVYTYEINSKQAYKYFPAEKLRNLYFIYHSLDISKAIERLIEANEIKITNKDNLNEYAEKMIEKKWNVHCTQDLTNI